MQELLPDGGVIRKLWLGEHDKYRDHLLRLDATSRHSRFGGGVSCVCRARAGDGAEDHSQYDESDDAEADGEDRLLRVDVAVKIEDVHGSQKHTLREQEV